LKERLRVNTGSIFYYAILLKLSCSVREGFVCDVVWISSSSVNRFAQVSSNRWTWRDYRCVWSGYRQAFDVRTAWRHRTRCKFTDYGLSIMKMKLI